MSAESKEAPAKATVRDKFLGRVNAYLPAKAFSQHMSNRPPVPVSNLAYRNRVALVAGKAMTKLLQSYCVVQKLQPNTAPDSVGWQDMEVLLISGEILTYDEPWRKALLGLDDEFYQLKRLITQARANQVPVVLWLREEGEGSKLFAHLFDLVDVIFMPEGTPLNGAKMRSMGPVVDVKNFNPVIARPAERRDIAQHAAFLVDGFHEIGMKLGPDAASKMFEPYFDYNWWLTDTSFDVRNADHKIHSIMRRRFLGSLRGTAKARSLKLAQAYHAPGVMFEGRENQVRERCLEAFACKTCVITDKEETGLAFAKTAKTPKDLKAALDWILRDTIGSSALQHLAWRDTVQNRTIFEALEAIFEAAEVRPRLNQSKTPLINIVVPTVRPALVPYILKIAEAQTHQNIALSIVVNGADVSDETRALVAAHPIATLYEMPNYKTIGYCMNYGIDQVASDYWAKFDDDDVYGPNYLSDMLLQRKYAEFDITGKSSFFGYFEEDDKIHIRNVHARDAYCDFVGGGTILCKSGTNPFPEDVRGYADTLFFAEAATNGKTILASDPFNFLQVRRADPTSHTWTAGTQQLNLKGPQRNGLDMSGVIL
ncbi:glycosyltransferase family 2 protein [Lentibacter algarum]|uniref:glycosyltransferase n=1 Tax=Lentibacter algarum TaxID=576131 RepID=UPI001C073F9A|nr:glycosyltransferase family A protein [Lentibacter algarum]MBU2980663.1 glycosyltransferase family 2 protein [Lentibacter algarum]